MLLSEAQSDINSLKFAHSIYEQIIKDDKLLDEIVYKFQEYSELSAFSFDYDTARKTTYSNLNDSGDDDVFTVTKIYKEPITIKVRFKLYEHLTRNTMKAFCSYKNPPVVTFFIGTKEGKVNNPHDDVTYQYQHDRQKNTEMTRGALKSMIREEWSDVIIHELAHAYDYVYRNTTQHNWTTRSAYNAKNGEEYCDNTTETNARMSQYAYLIMNACIHSDNMGTKMPDFKQTISHIFDRKVYTNRGLMADDTKRRTYKRAFDIYNKLTNFYEKHKDEINSVKDFVNAIK